MNKELERRVTAIRAKMWKEIDFIIQTAEKELLEIKNEV